MRTEDAPSCPEGLPERTARHQGDEQVGRR